MVWFGNGVSRLASQPFTSFSKHRPAYKAPTIHNALLVEQEQILFHFGLKKWYTVKNNQHLRLILDPRNTFDSKEDFKVS